MGFLQNPEKKSLLFSTLSGRWKWANSLDIANCVKEVSQVTIANDIVRNIVGSNRPLIEQIVGETVGNLHLQRTCPDSAETCQRLKILDFQTSPFGFSIRILNVQRLVFTLVIYLELYCLDFCLIDCTGALILRAHPVYKKAA